MMAAKPSDADGASVSQPCAVQPPWREAFLRGLAMTSNVTASAKKAGVTTARVYELRRADPAFYREWQNALREGYDSLEMHLLQRLRDGEVKQPGTTKRPSRSFDNANALRLLNAHRESAVRRRNLLENQSPDTILETINAKIEQMKTAAMPLAIGDEASAHGDQ